MTRKKPDFSQKRTAAQKRGTASYMLSILSSSQDPVYSYFKARVYWEGEKEKREECRFTGSDDPGVNECISLANFYERYGNEEESKVGKRIRADVKVYEAKKECEQHSNFVTGFIGLFLGRDWLLKRILEDRGCDLEGRKLEEISRNQV